jgi:hypothetical protein
MADAVVLGYGGSAVVDGIQVLVTGGSFTRERNISYVNMISIPPTYDSRTRVASAEGTHIVTGSVNFDMTDAFMPKLATDQFLRRRHQFTIGLHDGIDSYQLENCYMTSLSLAGAPGGLITAAISFTSGELWSAASVTNAFIRDQVPLGYWYSGNTDVREWTFTVNQDVQGVYLNQDTVWPRYLRIGLWDATLEVTTFDQIIEHDAVKISTSTFTIVGNTGGSGYTLGGQTDLGTYTHRFDSGTELGTSMDSDAAIILVT